MIEEIKKNNWYKMTLKVLLWLLVVIVVICLIPLTINYLILYPAQIDIVGDGTHWLSFWGGYLGAIISAGVAFIILHIQYKQNYTENKKNRELQTSILEYQNQKSELTNFISMSSKLISSVNPNELKFICKDLGIPNLNAEIELKTILVSIINNYQKIALYLNEEIENQKILYAEINRIVNNYIDAIYDIKDLVHLLSISGNNELSIKQLKNAGNEIKYTSDTMMKIIERYEASDNPRVRIAEFQHIAMQRLEIVVDSQSHLHQIIEQYIREEEKRIENTLNYGII